MQAIGLAVQARAAARPMSALDAIALATRRRMDLVMIGDSNQDKDGYGFSGAWENALALRFGMYATGIGFKPTWAVNQSPVVSYSSCPSVRRRRDRPRSTASRCPSSRSIAPA
jgi:hypothetical protein